ncbi:MAG: type II secretion system protein [Kiritimatiellae bacterium]|nr:type II secretion system protein [Kiritimatiellia bacterium]
MNKSKMGFSLVELMVVIGILIILSGLITTGVSRLRANGKRTQCMNNLRAYGTELVSYLDDFQGRFPTATDKTNARAWFNILPERLKRPRMADLVPPQQDHTDFAVRIPNDDDFICPSMTYERTPQQDYYCSYAINEDLVSMGKKARLQNITDPAFFIFLCETPTPSNPKVDLNTITSNNEILSYRHRSSTIACFADGHVDAITKAAMEEAGSVYKWNYNEATEDLVDQQ